MKHRTILYLAALTALLGLGVALPAAGSARSQINPTQQKQTVDAAIGQLFTQTAAAAGQSALTETIEAAFQQAQTATAAFQGTVQAGFDQALTTTAEAARASYSATLQAERTPLAADNTAQIGIVTALLNGSGVVNLSFSPDGSLLGAGGIPPEGARVWDMATGDRLNLLPDSGSDIRRVAFSGGALAATTSSTIYILDSSGQIRINQRADFQEIQSLAFSPDGMMLAIAGGSASSGNTADYAIRLWDASTGQEIRQLAGHTAPVLDVAFSPDGTTLASGSADQSVRLWNVADGTQTGEMDTHTQAVGAIAFSPNGSLLASVGLDGTVVLWSLPPGSGQYVVDTITPGTSLDIAFSPDSTLLAAAAQDGVHLWNAETGANLGIISSQTPVSSAAFSPDGTLLAFANMDTVWLWGITNPAVVQVPSGTPTPSAGAPATATVTPTFFPTPTKAEIQVAEQVFEGGRMMWIQPTHQIWVMVVTGTGHGTWMVFDDTFQEGEPEFDPNITPPQGRYQPTRGFGKLWRENPDVRQALGWATTPEFGYVSPYEYHPGGEVVNGHYTPGPGYHILYSLYGEQFRFNEADGTWQLGSGS